MNRLNLIFCFLGVVVGSVYGYCLGRMEQADVLKVTASIQSELMTIAEKFSASRLLEGRNIKIGDNAPSENFRAQPRPPISEIEKIVYQSSALLKNDLIEEMNRVFGQNQAGQKVRLAEQEPKQSLFEETASKENSDYAQRVLSSAIESGVWDKNHAQAYNETFLEMTPQAQFEAVRRLSVAINNEDVLVAEDSLPF